MLFTLVVRLLYFIEHINSPFFAVPILDQNYYNLFAQRIMTGGDLGLFSGYRSALYPYFLSLIYRFSGSYGIEVSLLIQHLFGVITVFMVTLISTRLFRNFSIGILSGFLYAFAGPALFFEGELLITSFYTFLVTTTLFLHTKICKTAKPTNIITWILCGAMTAIAAQARTNILIFLSFYPLYAAYLFLKSKNIRSLLPLSALIGAVFVMVIFGFVNMQQSGRFHLIPSAGGINFYLGNKPGADGMIPVQDTFANYKDTYEDSVLLFARQEYRKDMLKKAQEPKEDPSAISKYWFKRTFNTLRLDPFSWLRLMVKKTFLIFWNYEIPSNKSFSFIIENESVLLKFLPVRWFILFAFVPLGVLMARESGNKNLLFLLIFFLVSYIISIVIFHVSGRFRIPLWPAMAVLAGGGLRNYWLILKQGKIKRILLFSATIILLSIFSLTNLTRSKTPSFARDYWFRSIANYKTNNYNSALQDIEESLKLDDSDFNVQLHYGNILIAQENYNKARDIFQEVSTHYPRLYLVWNNLGVTQEAMGDYEMAYRSYLSAIGLHSESIKTLENLLLLELRADMFELAEERIILLNKLDQDNVVAVLAESFIEGKHGNVVQARELEKKAFRINKPVALWAQQKLNSKSLEKILFINGSKK